MSMRRGSELNSDARQRGSGEVSSIEASSMRKMSAWRAGINLMDSGPDIDHHHKNSRVASAFVRSRARPGSLGIGIYCEVKGRR